MSAMLDMIALSNATRCALGASGCLILSACGEEGWRETARRDFSFHAVCPLARVTASERHDILPHTLILPHTDPVPIPNEVESDPERLELWKKRVAFREWSADNDGSVRVWDVEGCGHKVTIACGQNSRGGCYPASAYSGILKP
jgi:hypothetical protein